jgi:hypothetical protein
MYLQTPVVRDMATIGGNIVIGPGKTALKHEELRLKVRIPSETTDTGKGLPVLSVLRLYGSTFRIKLSMTSELRSAEVHRHL